MRVDRDIDREKTAVAAVSERYRGDNVFRAAAPTDSSMHLLLNSFMINVL
jgi:hypothetical protein